MTISAIHDAQFYIFQWGCVINSLTLFSSLQAADQTWNKSPNNHFLQILRNFTHI